MFKKRLLAYIIDFVILGMIISTMQLIIPTSKNIQNLNQELLNTNEQYMNNEIDTKTYINQYSNISYTMDKDLFMTTLISTTISIVYFVVYPLYNKGQSIGKKLQKIRIIGDKELSGNALLIRYLFMDGIGTSIITLCLILVIKDTSYIICTTLLTFLQFLVVIISIFMVLYRHDFKSLPDIIAGTKVIEVKE